jgi:hypothetical protein
LCPSSQVSKAPALRRIDSGREWTRTPSFTAALSLTEATEVKLLVWEMTRQDRAGREGLNGAVRPDAAAAAAPADIAAAASAPPSSSSPATPPSPSASSSSLDSLPRVDKSAEQRARLSATLLRVTLFRQLAPAQMAAIVDAMFERRVAAGETVIRQGDEADNFYVVESGDFDVFVAKHSARPDSVECKDDLPAAAPEAKLVMQYGPGGTFGELALLHDAARAATVVARNAGALWAVRFFTCLHAQHPCVHTR